MFWVKAELIFWAKYFCGKPHREGQFQWKWIWKQTSVFDKPGKWQDWGKKDWESIVTEPLRSFLKLRISQLPISAGGVFPWLWFGSRDTQDQQRWSVSLGKRSSMRNKQWVYAQCTWQQPHECRGLQSAALTCCPSEHDTPKKEGLQFILCLLRHSRCSPTKVLSSTLMLGTAHLLLCVVLTYWAGWKQPFFLFSQEMHSFQMDRFRKENAMSVLSVPVSLHITMQEAFLITFVIRPQALAPVGRVFAAGSLSVRQRVNGGLVWDAALEFSQEIHCHVTALFVDLEPENQGYIFKSKKNGICSRV